MKRHVLLPVLLLAALLAGCAQAAATGQPSPPTATATAAAAPNWAGEEPVEPTPPEGKPPPETTPGTAEAYPAAAETPPELAYPAEQGALAAPTGEAVPFTDCTRAPALSGCVSTWQPLPGRLAFAETTPRRVIGLDLQTGQAWQAPLEGDPDGLDWSPDGAQLLAVEETGAGEQYALFSADGVLLERFTAETQPAWMPGGELNRGGPLRSAEGWEAELVETPDFRQELRFRAPGGDWRTLPLPADSPDTLYSLRGWQAGAPRLLAMAFLPGNAALMFGGELLLVDLEAETAAPLGISAPLDEGSYAWNPAQTGWLAVAAGGPPEGARRLALYNAETGELRYPLPEGVQVETLAWRPDGARLAFAAGELAANASPAAVGAFPAAGIYLLDPQTGDVEALPSPPGAQDGWPQWAGADTLVYARALPLQNGGLGIQARARSLADGAERLLVDGLPAPPTAAGRVFFGRVLDFRPSE